MAPETVSLGQDWDATCIDPASPRVMASTSHSLEEDWRLCGSTPPCVELLACIDPCQGPDDVLHARFAQECEFVTPDRRFGCDWRVDAEFKLRREWRTGFMRLT